MRNRITYSLLLIIAVAFAGDSFAQGIHFSQFYNAPMLLSPANTGLLQQTDYRVGANYRNQWSSLPVPYNTFSMYGDICVAPNESGTAWLGMGAAVFTDRAGDGDLSLTRYEGCLAYHLFLNDYSMLSFGVSGAYVQRSVDYAKLTFDQQWNGFYFDPAQANGEIPGIKKTSYIDAGAGINLSLFPNDDLYMKFGIGAQHLNQPKETFYTTTNNLGIRPEANFDIQVKVSHALIMNPSGYFTYQKAATEMVFGTLFLNYLGGLDEQETRLILGVYYRMGDAVIAALGMDYGHLRMMATYDITASGLSPYNNSNGAVEIGVRWEGTLTRSNGILHKVYNCPRF